LKGDAMRMQVLSVTMSEAQISKLTEMAKELGMTRSNLVRILTSYPLEKRIEIDKSKLNQNEKELK